MNTIMLDTKTSKHGKVFCDAIVTSDNVSKSPNRMITLYSRGLQQETANLSKGISYTLSYRQVPYIIVNIYDSHGKIMIQPGGRKEDNLLPWLNDFNHMKADGSNATNGMIPITRVLHVNDNPMCKDSNSHHVPTNLLRVTHFPHFL